MTCLRPRPVVAAAFVAILTVALGLPADAEARKKRRKGPAVAVWDVFVDDDHRAEAWHWYSRISEAIDDLEDLSADDQLVFEPRVMPAEGVSVAALSASRWLDGAWVAFRGREYDVAARFAEDALRMVEGFPPSRLPDGLVRDLELMVARVRLEQGRNSQARTALRAVVLLDPSWRARDGWEKPELIALWEEVASERAAAPPAHVVVQSKPFAQVLLFGVVHGDTGPTGQLELQLPPGIYEVTGRKAGFADHTERIHLRPHDVTDVALPLAVKNSPGFQEGLVAALADPGQQRRSSVWVGLEQARATIAAEAVLVARYASVEDEEHGRLQVGLYLPGRRGWGFYREVDLCGDLGADQLGVESAIEDLLVAIDMARHPVLVAAGD